MSDTQGRFVWYELMTTDRAAAEAFYAKVVGWGTQRASGDMPYTLFTAGELPVSGTMDMPQEVRASGTPPVWFGYIGVDDVDATAAKVEAAGGTIHVPPRDIDNVGRFAMVADPQGAAFGLMKWANPMPDSPVPMGTPGRPGWHELMARDWEQVLPFYLTMFGWEKDYGHDMGPMGIYQVVKIPNEQGAGLFNKPAGVPEPFWLYYFNVENIDAAADRVKTAGGQIVEGPMEVPEGAWIVQGLDPQGAMFALVGPKAG